MRMDWRLAALTDGLVCTTESVAKVRERTHDAATILLLSILLFISLGVRVQKMIQNDTITVLRKKSNGLYS